MKSLKSLKLNTIANFSGLIYSTIITIAVLPLYIQYLGAEAFGLVGFFTTLQTWMQLFDMGMSPILSRQAAQVRGQNINFLTLKKLLRSLELIFLPMALIVGLGICAGSSWIANHWLNIKSLALPEVTVCIYLMGAMIGLRFFTTLYRSGILGTEKQIELNIANTILVTMKFIGALLLLRFVTQNLLYFFVYQLFIGIIELIILATLCYRFIPSSEKAEIRIFWDILKPLLPFAGGIAYSAIIWLLLTQLDKMILSNLLPLSQYGYFTLVVVIATGINQVSSPISQAILPRMTYLLSQGKEPEMLVLYKKSTQFMAVIMLPLTGMIALFSTELLFAWTENIKAAEWGGPILFWFSLGNGILAISAFQYYLQYAHGQLKMHVIYSSISVLIQTPIIVYVAFEHGALGVAIAWFVLRVIAFLIWTPIVHNKFAPSIHWSWLSRDIAPILISTTTSLILINNMNINFLEMPRIEIFGVLISIGLIVVIINMLISSACRQILITAIQRVSH
jgi:O-antigen/teichoic acid export membrane protein